MERHIPPRVWGPHWWFVLHNLADTATTPNAVGEHKKLMASLISRLPCQECVTHGKKWLAKHFIDNIETRTDLKQWMVDFHNSVNDKLGKPKKKEWNAQSHTPAWKKPGFFLGMGLLAGVIIAGIGIYVIIARGRRPWHKK
jgi:hypothetical protein